MTSTDRRGGSLLDEVDNQSNRTGTSTRAPAASFDKKMLGVAALVTVCVGVLAYVVYSTYAGYVNDPKRQAFFSVVSDSETGEVNDHFPLPTDGQGYPAVNPKTGKRTFYPSESCYWTKDGKAKLQPTYVILNSWLKKPGPTRCPDCGRTVTKSNRMPPDALMQQAWDAQASTKK